MSKVRENFLEQVSKSIKKSVFEDGPDTASGSMVIDRLQSLTCGDSPDQRSKAVDLKSDTTNACNDHALIAATHTTSLPPIDAKYRPADSSIESKDSLGRYQDKPSADESLASGGSGLITTSRPLATILVVDDEIVTQRLIRTILEERGYEVVVAEDGVDALMMLGKMKFDLMLCDIIMPNIDGFTLVEFMNKKSILIPVIFITVREEVEDEIRGLALGAMDYIRKPINRDLLLLRIRKALDK